MEIKISGFLTLLGLLFIGLKLSHIIFWSWWFVLWPFWIIPVILSIVSISILIFCVIYNLVY